MKQMPLKIPAELPPDAYSYGERSSGGTHGVVLTRRHVVELILDLAGYLPSEDLTQKRLLEPSCGHGAFLVPAVERLLVAVAREGRSLDSLRDAIRAFDIDPEHVSTARDAVGKILEEHGYSRVDAESVAADWIQVGDFLLSDDTSRFDCVVGNPPYIRIEEFSSALQAVYRNRYASLFDRADLYVAFIEHGLNLLAAKGVLSFICADRWILNRYGSALRRIVTEKFNLRYYVDLHRTSPFDSDVIAYPSIFSIRRGVPGPVQVASLSTASEAECSALRASLAEGGAGDAAAGVTLATYEAWFAGDEPWIVSSPDHLKALRDLEARFEPIETLARVGIGAATGNDGVYIVTREADIEEDRLVPLVMRTDIRDGRIISPSRFVINTFGDDGRVINLADYPRLARYLDLHAVAVKQRHVARKNGRAWFRTIDRVYPELVGVPKLLIPDIAGSNEVVFDDGRYHPHHNLYFVTSEVWDMEVLGGLLSSKVALFFVWSYAVKMRGRYLRFQAQYLRRIRLPQPNAMPKGLSEQIRVAFRARDFKKLDALALNAYQVEALPEFDFVDTRR